MTIVIAQKRNDSVLLLADTKINDPKEIGPDVFPGRLKLVILDKGMTVAFSGDADPAGVVLRDAHKVLRKSGPQATIDFLTMSSSDGRTDYVVAAHMPEARLLIMRKGGVVEEQNIWAIGDTEPFKELIDKARDADAQDFFKSELRSRFFDRLLTNKELGDHIGGFPVAVGATSKCHRYLFHHGAYTYTFPTLKWGEETHQPIDQVYSGDGHFELGIMPPDVPNVPVLGAYSLQARIGYVYSPIENSQAFPVPLWDQGKPWHGHESEMYDTLRKAITEHVAKVAT